METLPELASTGHPKLQVITTAAEPPRIVRHLARFDPDPEVLAKEAKRYAGIKNLTAQEKGVLVAHEALEEGRVLIDLDTTMRKVNSENWPLLGLARLGDRKLYCLRWNTGPVELRATKHSPAFYNMEGYSWSGAPSWRRRLAAVPRLPAELRTKENLRNPELRILWEAQWTSETQARPPVDPALIEHIAGSLYAVIAVWDLSPLERAVLFGNSA